MIGREAAFKTSLSEGEVETVQIITTWQEESRNRYYEKDFNCNGLFYRQICPWLLLWRVFTLPVVTDAELSGAEQ